MTTYQKDGKTYLGDGTTYQKHRKTYLRDRATYQKDGKSYLGDRFRLAYPANIYIKPNKIPN